MSRLMYVFVLLSSLLLASLPVSARIAEEPTTLNAPTVPGDEYWDDRFGCFIEGTIQSMAVFQDRLYASSYGLNENGCYRSGQIYTTMMWIDNHWESIYDHAFLHMTVTSTTLYGLQWESSLRQIHAYDGTTWTVLPSLPNANQSFGYRMQVFQDQLYVASSHDRIYRWTGSAWVEIATMNNEIVALAISDHYLYAAGVFTETNGIATNLARWNGSQWYPVGVPTEIVLDLEIYQGALYCLCSDSFSSSTYTFQRWSGTTWELLETFTDSGFYQPELMSVGESLYLYGADFSIDEQTYRGIVRWENNTWENVGSELGPFNGDGYNGYRFCNVCAVLEYQDDIVIGGIASGGVQGDSDYGFYHPIWRLIDDQWHAMPEHGIHSGSIGYTLLPQPFATPDGVYVSGRFEGIGNISAQNNAFWNGQTWLDISAGLSDDNKGYADPVVVNDTLYVFGGIQACCYGNAPGTRILQRTPDGQWSELLTEASVTALEWWNGSLYALGTFTSVSNGQSQVIRWDGSQWLPVGNFQVDLALFDLFDLEAGSDGLYVVFVSHADPGTTQIQKWNTSSWSPVGNAFNSTVGNMATLEWHNNQLYLGGDGGLGLWQFNGTTWQQLASVPIYALASGHDGLYVGGNFTEISGTSANSIARFDEGTWNALGSGLTSVSSSIMQVWYLAVQGRNVYVSGIFEQAGGHSSLNFAIWHNPTGPNTNPSTRSESRSLGQGQAIELDLHDYAWDLDADPLTFSNLTLSRGTLTDLGNGRFRIQAPFDGTQPLTLTYIVSDDHGGSTVGNLEWTISTRYLTYLPFLN